MDSIIELLGYLWREHRGKFIGISIGFIFGLMTAIIGFGKTLFISLCVALGFFVGKRIDQGQDIEEFWQRFRDRW
ncbi:MAG: hypothetical protein PWP31_44 [Clostridia bacterium]|nr:hypothetical protein [Clostridia bacterium]